MPNPMIRKLIHSTACTLLFLTFPTLAADNQLTAEEQAQGWQLLFNGNDMSQWRNYQQPTLNSGWQIEEGAMKLASQGAGDIVSKASYQNFELKLDWKIALGGNSGIFIGVDETGYKIYSHAPEIQILDNERHPDNKLESHRSGSLYDMIASPKSSHKAAGEWNQVQISLKQGHLRVIQNGVLTADIQMGSADWQQKVAASKFRDWAGFGVNSKGQIGLQDHGDVVWFKNIKIKELK